MKIYFDGGCSPNPGRMSICIVVCRPNQPPQPYTIDNLGLGTNNAAEWSGLIWAALWAKDNGINKIKIIGDSKLAVKQASGHWNINNKLLIDLFQELKKISQGMSFNFCHVPRDHNLAGIYLEHGSI